MSDSALTNTLNRHDLTPRTSIGVTRPAYPTSAFVTHLVYLFNTSIQVDKEALTEMGVQCVRVSSAQGGKFDAGCVREALESILYSQVD